MTATFYGVLGVESDVDAEAIDESYRERVTDVHPDVNDDPDADAQFQRLTTARDVLTDEAERARYDRLGHVSYLRHHVDCAAWTDLSRSDHSPSEQSDRQTDSDRRNDDLNEDRTNADTASSETDSTDSKTERTGPRSTPGADKAQSTPGADKAQSTARDDSNQSWGTDSTNDTKSRDDTSTQNATGSYATTSFWETPSFRWSVDTASLFSRVSQPGRDIRTLLWVLLHSVFLAAAAGTALYVYFVVLAEATVSAPLLLVLIGEVGLAVVLSSVHVFSRLAR